MIKQAPLDYMECVSPFGMRLHPVFKKQKMHWGADYEAKLGTPMYAIDNGGKVVVSKMQGNGKGYGNYIVIEYPSLKRDVLVCHLERRVVEVGDVVFAGQIIGYVGSTGDSTGPHAHVGICKNFNAATDAERGWEDPVPYMEEVKKHMANHWALPFLQELEKKGIIDKNSTHEKSLDSPFTKGEVIAIVCRVLKMLGK